MRGHRWPDRGRRIAVVLGALLTLGAVPSSGSAQTVDEFVGYDASASGTSLSAFPTLPALLPVEVPFEATLGLATATLSSGGQGFGRASTLFPGSLVTGLRQLIEQGAGASLPIPDYPIVVEAREHEPAKRREIPGITMFVDADPERSLAVADAGSAGVEGLLGIGSMRTESRVDLETGGITASSVTTLTGLEIAGVFKIGSLVSESTVHSDGTTATCSGDLSITGATLAGTPIIIDDEGIHASGDTLLPGLGLGSLVEDILSGLGLDVRALGGDDECSGSFGSRTTTGLLVRLPLPAFGPVPAGGGVSLVLGSTSASAGASVLPPAVVPAPESQPGIGDVVTSPGAPVTGGVSLPPAASPTPSGNGGGASPLPVEPASYDFDGVPPGLLVGLFLLAVVASGRVRRYMDRIIGLVGP